MRPSAADLLPGPEGTVVAGFAPPQTPPTPDPEPPQGRGRLALAVLGGVGLLLAGIAVGVMVAGGTAGSPPDSNAMAAAETGTQDDPGGLTDPTTPTTACVDLRYLPCGQTEPAAGTDGTACLSPRVDHDEDPANGCEAVPDEIDDAELTDGEIRGTIVPIGDVDKVLVPLPDRWQLFCDARVRLSLTAPEGLDLEMQIFNEGDDIGTVDVPAGQTAVAEMSEPSCASDDSTTLEVVIRSVGGRSADEWILEKDGSW
jgi:hypothetical protein